MRKIHLYNQFRRRKPSPAEYKCPSWHKGIHHTRHHPNNISLFPFDENLKPNERIYIENR